MPTVRPGFQLKQRSIALGFLAPALLLFALVSWWLIVESFIVAFRVYSPDPTQPSRWAGLENFRQVLVVDCDVAATAWLNVLLFVVLGILVGFVIPVVLAIAINEMRHGISFFRIAYYLPA